MIVVETANFVVISYSNNWKLIHCLQSNVSTPLSRSTWDRKSRHLNFKLELQILNRYLQFL